MLHNFIMSGDAILHIPDGINFDCTGCGNCCFAWPVPLTDDDVSRICSLEFDRTEAIKAQKIEPVHIIKTGASASLHQKMFTNALGKRADGKCQYLSPDNRCEIHAHFGEEAKPSMCRLFPYTFTPTPNGVYASASFASTGVLYNSGRPLTEQKEHLERTYELFRALYGNLSPDWSGLQLIDGQSLPFDEYLQLERNFLLSLSESNNQRADKILCRLATQSSKLIKERRDPDRIPGLQTKPKTVDSLLLKALIDAYFPADVYAKSTCEIDTESLARSLVAPPDKVQLEMASANSSATMKVGLGELNQYTLGPLNEESESLLKRFAYLKVFSKLYFGAGFAGLSLIAGLNHLSTLVSLIRIILKMKTIEAKTKGVEISFEETAECVRTLERRLTVASFSNQTKTVLEVLLSSTERAERIASLAS